MDDPGPAFYALLKEIELIGACRYQIDGLTEAFEKARAQAHTHSEPEPDSSVVLYSKFMVLNDKVLALEAKLDDAAPASVMKKKVANKRKRRFSQPPPRVRELRPRRAPTPFTSSSDGGESELEDNAVFIPSSTATSWALNKVPRLTAEARTQAIKREPGLAHCMCVCICLACAKKGKLWLVMWNSPERVGHFCKEHSKEAPLASQAEVRKMLGM